MGTSLFRTFSLTHLKWVTLNEREGFFLWQLAVALNFFFPSAFFGSAAGRSALELHGPRHIIELWPRWRTFEQSTDDLSAPEVPWTDERDPWTPPGTGVCTLGLMVYHIFKLFLLRKQMKTKVSVWWGCFQSRRVTHSAWTLQRGALPVHTAVCGDLGRKAL